MTDPATETEKLILEAARKVFIRNGFDGTTMQMIADEARINKALLHYYYRSKDRLFEGVFLEAFKEMVPRLQQILFSGDPFFQKIGAFVENYISTLQHVPEIPIFILHELRRNPDRVVDLVKSSGIEPSYFTKLIHSEIEKGTIQPTDPLQLLVNMLAMCIFPFAARPIIQGFILNNDEAAFDVFIEKRKTAVTQFIINSIKK
jgi:AcrR family transcriptional regulator